MNTEEQRKEEIKKAFFEYAKENELSEFNTISYYARQFLPDESFFLKRQVINELIDSGILVIENEKYVIQKLAGKS